MGKSYGVNDVQTVARVRPLVAIVGRPNVGKSTLFNRVVRSRLAITDDRPGVTRDRIYAEAEWDGRRFTLVDTGGYIPQATDAVEVAVRVQAETAIAEADVILLVCDAGSGLTDLDREVAEMLRRSAQPSLLIVNKIDHPNQDGMLDEFHALGLGEPISVSAATGRKSGDLLARIVQVFDDVDCTETADTDDAIRVALAGRPNVGKSTLINRLAGFQVSIVHDQPGTTRDTTSIRLACQGREFLLMDTAGLRRRAKVDDQIEYYSGRRAVSSIEGADVVIVLIDAVEGWVVQDARIIGQAIEAGCGLIVVVNKWDLVEKNANRLAEYRADLYERFPFLVDYPILFISALTGKRVQRCLDCVVQVDSRRRQRITTSRLNAYLEKVVRTNPPLGGGRELKVLYATQQGVSPPTFVIFANRPELIPSTYRRFIEKKLRDGFDFSGTPIRIYWRRRRGK